MRTRKREAKILAWLHANPGWQYGYVIWKEACKRRASPYPELIRLERAGWIERKWIDQEGDKPPRRMGYRVKPR